MFKFIKELIRIVKSYKEDTKTFLSLINENAEHIEELIKQQKQTLHRARTAEAFIRERTEVSVDIGVRGPSTVIATGVYKGREYVEIFDMPLGEFDRLVEHLRYLKRHAGLRVDAPLEMKCVIDSELNKIRY